MPLKLLYLRLAAASALLLSAPMSHAQNAAPLSASRIREDVRILASDAFLGRGPGQAGEAKTLDHLVAQFKMAGLQPGGQNGSWLQAVPLTRFDREAVDMSLTTRNGSQPLAVGRDVTAALRRAGRTQLLDAPLVFVGYGVTAPELGYDNFAGVDLSGKVAIVLANDPDFEAAAGSPASGKFGGRAMVYPGRFGAKVAAAQAKGAAAVLVIHEDAAASYPWRQVANGDSIPSMELATASGAGNTAPITGWLQRDVAVRLLKESGLDLEALKVAARDPAFKAVPISRAALSASISVTAHPVVSHNVVARLPGRVRPDETVIFGAHWDANGQGAPDATGDNIRNGAVDNATGTAELLEVARAFGRGPRPARSVVFIAYTAEEKGLLGAEHLAANPPFSLERTAAVINLDPHVMLGRARSLELVGGGRTDLEANLVRAARQERLRVEPEPQPEAGWYFRSDHYAFARRGVPALSFRIGRDLIEGGPVRGRTAAEAYNTERYHQVDDEFDPKWTAEGAAQEATVAWRVGLELANTTAWPAWTDGAEFKSVRATSADARRR